jgi:hypothetical protein
MMIAAIVAGSHDNHVPCLSCLFHGLAVRIKRIALVNGRASERLMTRMFNVFLSETLLLSLRLRTKRHHAFSSGFSAVACDPFEGRLPDLQEPQI